jgi:hypothetical protein
MRLKGLKALPVTARSIFTGMLAVAVLAVLGSFSPAARPTAASPIDRWADSISPGFSRLPRGVIPINRIGPSRIPHAHPSYAWIVRAQKRELLAFSTPIQHVIIIYMENRTPEDLFGGFYNVTNPNTGHPLGVDLDLANPSVLSPALTPEPLQYGENPGHNHYPDFYKEATNGVWPTSPSTPNSGYWYVPSPAAPASSSVDNYIDFIEQFAYENHTLQSNEGPSFVSHQYAIAGQSGGLSGSSIAENGMTENPKPAGAGLPGHGTCYDNEQTDVVDMYAIYPTPSATPSSMPTVSPCQEYATIFDVLMTAQPSPGPTPRPTDDVWQYVASDKKSIWAAPMSVQHLYSAYSSASSVNSQPFAVDPDAENFVLNVTQSTNPTPNPHRPFAQLTYLTPCLGESDHPNAAAPYPLVSPSAYDDGPDWLSYVVDAVGASSYWGSTAIIVTWDDWGGFYDNYSPSPWPYHTDSNPYSPAPGAPGNPHDPNEWGFRVPLMVISPYAKAGYISTKLISQGSILNFVETILSLPTNALGGDDLANKNNDLTDMFDFSQQPLPAPTVPSNFTAANMNTCPPPTPTPPP